MPVTPIDSASAGATVTTGNAPVCPVPAGLAVGHFVIAQLASGAATGGTLDMPVVPADLTLVDAQMPVIPGIRSWTYAGFITSIPANFTWQMAQAGTWTVALQCFSGVDPNTPIDVFSAQPEAGVSDASLAVNALDNTGVDDYQVVALSAHAGTVTGTTYTFPGGVGWGNQTTAYPSTGAQRNSVIASRQLAAEDPAGFDVTASFGGEHNTVAIALNAESGETLRPTGVSGLSNLTGAYTDIDQDPDGTITDAGLVGADPSGVAADLAQQYVDGPASATAWTGGTLPTHGTYANLIDTSETTSDALTMPSINTDYLTWLSHAAGDFSAIPDDATINSLTVTLIHTVTGTVSRLTHGLQLATANGAAIGAEQVYANGASGVKTSSVNPGAWSVLPTVAQLKSGSFGYRFRCRRSNTLTSYLVFAIKVVVNYTTAGSTVNTQVDVAMGDPVGTLATGADTGELRARFRKRGTGSNPQGRLEARNAAGTLLGTVIANTPVTESDADGQLAFNTFDQSILTSKTDVVLRFVGTGASGGLAELVAVEWNAQISAGATTHNRSVPDAVGVADSAPRVAAFARPEADAAAVADGKVQATTVARSKTDSAAVADAPLRASTFARVEPDMAVVADTPARAGTYARLKGDAAVAADTPSRLQTHARSKADAAAVADLAARVISVLHSRSVPDVVVVGDANTRAASYARSAQDAILVADSLARAATYARAVADALVVADAVVRVAAFARVSPEGLAVLDTPARTISTTRSKSDAAAVADSPARVASYYRSAPDTAGVADTALRVAAFLRSSANAAAVADVPARTLIQVVARAVSDAAQMADTPARVASYSRPLNDPTSVLDGNLAALTARRTPTDAALTADVVSRVASYVRAVSEGVPVADAPSRVLTGVLARSVADAIAAVDAAQRVASYKRTPADVAAVAEAAARALSAVRAISNAAAVADAPSRVLTSVISRAVTNALAVADVAVRVATRAQAIADGAAAQDLSNAVQTHRRTEADAAAVEDTPSRLTAAVLLRTKADAVTVGATATVWVGFVAGDPPAVLVEMAAVPHSTVTLLPVPGGTVVVQSVPDSVASLLAEPDSGVEVQAVPVGALEVED